MTADSPLKLDERTEQSDVCDCGHARIYHADSKNECDYIGEEFADDEGCCQCLEFTLENSA